MSLLWRIVSQVKEMMKMNSEEEFMPKWYPSMEKKSKVAENILAGFLMILLAIFTLGIVSGIQHTSNAMKGKE